MKQRTSRWTILLGAIAIAAGGCTGQEKTCSADQTLVNGICYSLQSDALNCGRVGNACGGDQGCSSGACVDCAANPAACTAAVAVACFNDNAIRFIAEDLTPVGPALTVGAGPNSLTRAAGTFFVANDMASTVTPFTLAPLRALDAIAVPAAAADLSHVAAHGGLLYASSSQMGTLVVIDPGAGQVMNEVQLAQTPGEYVNPQGIDFAGAKAYLALAGPGAVAVLDIATPSVPKLLKRIDVARYATGTAAAYPSRVLAAYGRIYVALANIQDSSWAQVPGAHGKLVAIDPVTDTVVGDTALDLGPDCLDASALALSGTTLWVGCGYYDFKSGVHGGGLLPISISGSAPQPGAFVKTPEHAVDALAICGERGYAGATDSGTVLAFDPSSGALGLSAEACPALQYGSFVPDLACVR